MARNEEKQLGRLNRLWLKQLNDESKEKDPPRPKLASLNSAEDLKKWLPSIKKDIDFCLKQSQVPCYPQRKIDEYNERIDHLQREYRAFVRKLREKDPDSKVIPWVERAYKKTKRTGIAIYDSSDEKKVKVQKECKSIDTNSVKQVTDSVGDFTPINAPILQQSFTGVYGYEEIKPVINTNCNSKYQDEPLQFKTNKDEQYMNEPLQSVSEGKKHCKHELVQCDSRDEEHNKQEILTSSDRYCEHQPVLNLPYSDSSDSEPS